MQKNLKRGVRKTLTLGLVTILVPVGAWCLLAQKQPSKSQLVQVPSVPAGYQKTQFANVVVQHAPQSVPSQGGAGAMVVGVPGGPVPNFSAARASSRIKAPAAESVAGTTAAGGINLRPGLETHPFSQATSGAGGKVTVQCQHSGSSPCRHKN